MLAAAGERFEHGLGAEIGAFRVDMAKEFAAVHVDLAATRLSFVKWSVLLCVGLVAAISGIMALLLRAIVSGNAHASSLLMVNDLLLVICASAVAALIGFACFPERQGDPYLQLVLQPDVTLRRSAIFLFRRRRNRRTQAIADVAI